MNKAEFLSELQKELESANFSHAEEAVEFYEEMILDKAEEENITEDEALNQMPGPKEAAQQILLDENAAQKAFYLSRQSADSESDLHGEVRITKTVKSEGIYKIDVLTSNTGINLSAYDGEDIKISYTEDPENEIQYDFSAENGEILLHEKKRGTFYSVFTYFRSQEPVEVLVPNEITSKFFLETSNAKIKAENIKTWGNVEIKTSNASITVKNLEAPQIDAETDNGKIKASGLKIMKDASFDSSNAGLELFDISCDELYADTSNGSINAQNVKAQSKAKLDTSNGSIKIEGLESAYIDLDTSNGSIRGRIAGNMDDYSIISSTTFGKNNLPEHKEQGDKQLKASTSMGSINISFN